MTAREILLVILNIAFWWCIASLIAGLIYIGIALLSKRKFKE